MKKILDSVDKIIHKFSISFVIILFAIITIGMLFINSIYLYIDKPDFQINHIGNYLGIIISIVGIVILTIINKWIETKFSKNKYITAILFAIYFIAEFIYLKMVPIKPFSDMLKVTEIAFSNFNQGIEYLQQYPNNLPITIIFWLMLKLYNGVMIIKLGNVVCNIITIYFAYKIYKNIYHKENKMVVFLGIFSMATFLYVNHVYNDIIFVSFTTIMIYIVTKENMKKKDIIILSILSFIQFIIRPVGIILIIAISMYLILKKYKYKTVAILIVIFVIGNLLYGQLEKILIPKSEEVLKYPIWSFIQMGINEEEFGFQDASHSTQWTFQDVINRTKELGIKRLTKLLTKKEFWLWTEGTYQVERYAFGNGTKDLFYYETPVTIKISNPETSRTRKALDYLMKGQYFILVFLSLIELIIKEKEELIKNKKDLLLYFIIGMFCFYLIWEMKSRYIYCLYPIYLILATGGIDKIINKIEKIRRKENIRNEK